MGLEDALARVSAETGIPEETVRKTYRAYWRKVREYIVSLPLKEDLTDEEFGRLRPNVNIPSLGKLNVTLERYRTMKRIHNELKG
jgi:hypothetical protein